MAKLKEFGPVENFAEILRKGQELLERGELTAIAWVEPEVFHGGKAYVATHLAEFGDPWDVLEMQIRIGQALYGTSKQFTLHHGPMRYPRPEGLVEGWMLVVVHS